MMDKYLLVEKKIGETPLQATERLRDLRGLPQDIPLAYAGRLDPMASGTLLILVGDECKKQKAYHNLDKEYRFSVLFGVASDTGDVLGIVRSGASKVVEVSKIQAAVRSLRGAIELPYPHFSSKPVQGKPLHVWAVEGRIDEIEIPKKQSYLYTLTLDSVETVSGSAIVERALKKIHLLPPVTEHSKALGRDFRRTDVCESWERFLAQHAKDVFQQVSFRCICSSGTYMRTLAETIAALCGTCGLAASIHRTTIGRRLHWGPLGFWVRRF